MPPSSLNSCHEGTFVTHGPAAHDFINVKPGDSLAYVLSRLRENAEDFLQRWERDEDGWRKLPPRSWPTKQPDADQIPALERKLVELACPDASGPHTIFDPETATPLKELKPMSGPCREAAFDLATALVFNNMDCDRKGHNDYRGLADRGDLDGVVATGICLVEGIGVEANERQGLKWLQRAAKAGSSQGYYELGSLHYRGLQDTAGRVVVAENDETAFQYYSEGAKQGHRDCMFMRGDCLLEGLGCAKDEVAAVPLLYASAELGHRFARQRIRELLRGDFGGS
jgi:hypothetical protein